MCLFCSWFVFFVCTFCTFLDFVCTSLVFDWILWFPLAQLYPRVRIPIEQFINEANQKAEPTEHLFNRTALPCELFHARSYTGRYQTHSTVILRPHPNRSTVAPVGIILNDERLGLLDQPSYR